MAGFIVEKIRPGKGFAHAFHVGFVVILPIVILLLVHPQILIRNLDPRFNFEGVALAILLLSKWRMFALHPRYWITNVRANAVDIIVGLGFLVFIAESSAIWLQIAWVLLFEIWLLFFKPRTSSVMISLQALIAQAIGSISVFLAFEDANLVVYVAAFWLISYFSARHFLNSFEEGHGRVLASIWAFFSSSLMWALGHWLLFVGPIAQPALLICVIAFGLAGLYYLDQNNHLSRPVKSQIILTIFSIVIVIIISSHWGDATV